MKGRSRFVRLGYAIFSHPGPQTFYNGEPAQLMWPFNVRWNDFTVFRFHEVRISGFGPLFSGAFLISLVLLGITLVRPGIPREIVVLLVGVVVASLLVSVHTWWARYGPQLWWLPIIAVIAGLAVPGWRAARWTAWGLAALLLINAVLVGVAHFKWEIEATHTTYEQMALLRQKGEIKVDFQYFREPFGERLRAAGVTFRGVRRLPCDHPMELMSVVPGYPGTIHACFDESKSAEVTGPYLGQKPPGRTPQIFAPGILSLTNRMEARIAFSPDGNECFVTVPQDFTFFSAQIYYTKRVNNVWTPQVLAPFSLPGCACRQPFSRRMATSSTSPPIKTAPTISGWLSARRKGGAVPGFFPLQLTPPARKANTRKPQTGPPISNPIAPAEWEASAFGGYVRSRLASRCRRRTSGR